MRVAMGRAGTFSLFAHLLMMITLFITHSALPIDGFHTIRPDYVKPVRVSSLCLPAQRPNPNMEIPANKRREIGLMGTLASFPKRQILEVKTFFQRELPTARFLWPETSKLRLFLISSLALLVMDKWLNVQVPFIFQRAVDGLSSGNAQTSAIMSTLLLYGLTRTLSVMCSETKTSLFSFVSQDVLQRFSAQIFHHLHSLDSGFHLNTPSGVISVAYSRAVRGFQTMLFQLVFSVLPTALELAMVSKALWSSFGGVFAGIAMCTFLSYVVYTVFMTQYRLRLRQEMVKVDNDRNGFLIDSLLNHEVVKLYGNQELEKKKYDSFLVQIKNHQIMSTIAIACLNVGQAVLFGSGLVFSLVYALGKVKAGQMSVGDVVAVNALLLQVAVPFDYIGFTYQEIRQSFVDMGYMRDVLSAHQPTVRDSPLAQSLDHLAPRQGPAAVELCDVSFSYKPQGDQTLPVLRSLSLKVRPGENVALVGPSGSGKSTILKLITRMVDPTSGSVKLDGVDVKRVTLKSLRDRIAVVPQDTCLFDASIAHNIKYGDPSAPAELIQRAIERSNLQSTIDKLPDGVNTRVGERGNRLSGGERQKVSIARAIVRDPSLMLCDEVTSSVDALAERDIVMSLRRASSQRTTITVAHRLASIVHCDRILVLDKGRIVESGTHAELMRIPQGVYREMWNVQMSAHLDDPVCIIDDAHAEGEDSIRWLSDPQNEEDAVMVAEGYLGESEEDARAAEENTYWEYLRHRKNSVSFKVSAKTHQQ